MRLNETRVALLGWFQRLRALSGDDLHHHAAKRYRYGQIRGIIGQMSIMLAGNTVFAPAMSYQAWNSGINPLILAWTAAILIFSLWLFFHWRRMNHTDGSAHDMRWFKL